MGAQNDPPVQRTSSGGEATILRMQPNGGRTLPVVMSSDGRDELVQLHRDVAGLTAQVESMNREVLRMAGNGTSNAAALGSLQQSVEHILQSVEDVRSSQRALEASGLPIRVASLESEVQEIREELNEVMGRSSKRIVGAGVAGGGAGLTLGGVAQWIMQSLGQ